MIGAKANCDWKGLSPGAILLSVLLLGGCGPSMQMISIQTVPAGAEVFLQRRGEISVQGMVEGIGGSFSGGPFEEEFRMLGNAPLDYEFPLSETEASVQVGFSGGSVERHYREGTIRVELNGFQPVERIVTFNGTPLNLTLTLTPRSEPTPEKRE
jgi:hypothetical protein